MPNSFLKTCFTLLILSSPIVLASCASEKHSDPATTDHAHMTDGSSPYAGMEGRRVKALSESEIEQLLSGQGMGFAMPAELSGLPGPKHVLELATELELTDDQRRETQAVYDRMNTEARALGTKLIEAEESIDAAMADPSSVDSTEVMDLLAVSAQIRGKLRWSHIRAHIEQTEILTEDQRLEYVSLRGYDSEHKHDPATHGHDGHKPS